MKRRLMPPPSDLDVPASCTLTGRGTLEKEFGRENNKDADEIDGRAPPC